MNEALFMKSGCSIFAHSRAIALRVFASLLLFNKLLFELQAKKPLKYYPLTFLNLRRDLKHD